MRKTKIPKIFRVNRGLDRFGYSDDSRIEDERQLRRKVPAKLLQELLIYFNINFWYYCEMLWPNCSSHHYKQSILFTLGKSLEDLLNTP